MDSFENLKNEIKIPEGIDLAVKRGIERGRKEKKIKKISAVYKKIAVASIILIVTATAGIIHPNIVKAIPGIQSIFKLISHGNMGEKFEKFEKFSTSVNKTVEKNGIKITIDEIVIDDNILAITSTEEGNQLKENMGYMGSIKLNGNPLTSRNSKDKKINDNTIKTVTYANVSELDLASDIEVDLNIVWFNDVKGPWDFKFKVSKTDKPTNSKVIYLGNSIKIPNSTLTLDKLIISPLGNTITYSGIYDKVNESMRDGIYNFWVIDDKGRMLEAGGAGGSSNKEKYNGKIEIMNDLSSVKSLTIVPVLNAMGDKYMSINNLNYSILQTTINGTDFSVPQENIIKSRPVTEKEKALGYSRDSVTHVYNIDKARKFSTIEGLVNQTINVGGNNTVIIQSIEALEEETKVTFNIEGYGPYSYRHINSAVILDENYNDIEIAENGEGAIMENVEERIVSIKLPPIDKSGKYKIALPITEQPQIDEQYKINVDLTK